MGAGGALASPYFVDPDAVVMLVHQVQLDIFSNREAIYPNKTIK